MAYHMTVRREELPSGTAIKDARGLQRQPFSKPDAQRSRTSCKIAVPKLPDLYTSTNYPKSFRWFSHALRVHKVELNRDPFLIIYSRSLGQNELEANGRREQKRSRTASL